MNDLQLDEYISKLDIPQLLALIKRLAEELLIRHMIDAKEGEDQMNTEDDKTKKAIDDCRGCMGAAFGDCEICPKGRIEDCPENNNGADCKEGDKND